MTRSRVLGLAAIAVLTVVSGASANTIVNGSFENPVIAFPFYENFGPGCTGNCAPGALPNWTITTNNVDIVSSLAGGWPAAAADGNQYLDLVGYGSTGGISQTFATTPGLKYSLSFAYGNNPGSTSFASAIVNVAPVSSGSIPALLTASFSTTNNIGWKIFSASFLANSSSTTLSFDEVVGGNNGGVLLDAINVSATPLPSTWMLLLGGFVGLGFFAYCRTKKGSAVLAAA